jgi:hypothetical protein
LLSTAKVERSGAKAFFTIRVIGQAFLDCDFGVVFGEQGLDKKAEAGTHRLGT